MLLKEMLHKEMRLKEMRLKEMLLKEMRLKEMRLKEMRLKEMLLKEMRLKEMLLKEMPMLVHQTLPPNKPMYSMKMEKPQKQPRIPMMIQPLKTMTPLKTKTPLETTPQLDLPARQPAQCSLLWPSESLPLTTSKKTFINSSLS